MKEVNVSYNGVGVAGLLGVAFVIMKIMGIINWAWVWVLAPFWIPVVIVLALVTVYLILVMVFD